MNFILRMGKSRVPSFADNLLFSRCYLAVFAAAIHRRKAEIQMVNRGFHREYAKNSGIRGLGATGAAAAARAINRAWG